MPSRSPTPPSDTARLRAVIVAAGRRLGARGLIAAGEGNVSVRLGTGRLLITPSGRRKDELAAADLVVVPERADGGASPAEGRRPSSDIAIHRAIYAARADVLAVVHAHLPAAMALTLAGEVPDPAVLPETALLLPRLPFVPFAAAGSIELARAIAAALAQGQPPLPGAALLERHGAVAVGDAGDVAGAVEQALDRLELVEVLCRTWRDAMLIRAAATGLGGAAILRPPGTSPGAPARGRTSRQ
jgi:ribulose-5-phosphate 4-epimerase/fuculose-1-phosphate aldolase